SDPPEAADIHTLPLHDALPILVVFEGWFLTTPPQARAELEDPVNALEREEDRDGRWRRWCNDALARDYPPLWQRIDRLLYLQPPDRKSTRLNSSHVKISYAVFC